MEDLWSPAENSRRNWLKTTKKVHLGLGPALWSLRAGTELWEPHLRPSLSGFQLQNLSPKCNPIYLFIVSLLDVKLLKEPPPHKQSARGLCEGQDTGTLPKHPEHPPWWGSEVPSEQSQPVL